MRKPIALAASIIIIALALLAVNAWYLPDLNLVESSVALKDDGTVYLAENDGFTSCIFSVDHSASVRSVYWERSLKSVERSAVTQLVYGNDAVYFIREVIKTSDGSFGRWELLKLDPSLLDAQTLYTGSAADLPVSGGISVDGSTLYLTSVSSAGAAAAAAVYSLDTRAETPAPALLFEAAAPAGTGIVKAAYSDRVLHCLLGNGLAAQYRQNGTVIYPAVDGNSISAISAASGCVWLYDSKSNAVSCGTGYLAGDAVSVDSSTSICCGAATSNANMAMLASGSDTGFTLLRYNGVDFSADAELTIPVGARLAFKAPLILSAGILMIAAAIIILFVVYICKKSKRLATRLTAVFALVSVVLFLLLAGIVIKGTIGGYADARLAEATLWAACKSERIEELNLNLLSDEDFYGSETYAAIQKTLTTSIISTESSWFTVSGELFAVSEMGNTGTAVATLAVSQDKQSGAKFASACNSATAQVISAALTSGGTEAKTVLSRGRPTAICAAPVYSYGKITGLLVSYVISENPNMTSAAFHTVRGFLLLGGTMTLLAIIAVLLMARSFTQPLKLLISRMNDISTGRNELTEVRTGKDEIGELWREMQEMGISLAIKTYESNSMIQSFYRFVPRGLEKLLDRASIMEISLGDMTTMKNSVAILSVNNRDQMRETLNDNDFLDFVNASFTVISDNVSKHAGILLTGDFDLTSTKALFSRVPDDGIRFGLNVLGDAAENATAERTAPDLFVLLHSAAFLYGIVGTEDRAFPFLSSAEMNLLGSFSGDFGATGTKMVVTDQFLKTMKSSCSSRYIGFVSSADGRTSYKLHEILDAYSDLEKTRRMHADAKFQEGIRLFYKNDFYLARTSFSTVLKTCPGDGIARWYLFACEHYFNSGALTDIGYNLFGIRE